MNKSHDLFDLPPLPPFTGLPDGFTIPSTWKFLGTAAVAGIPITAVGVGSHFNVSYAHVDGAYQVVVSAEDHAAVRIPAYGMKKSRLILLIALHGIGRDLAAGHAIETGSPDAAAWQECRAGEMCGSRHV